MAGDDYRLHTEPIDEQEWLALLPKGVTVEPLEPFETGQEAASEERAAPALLDVPWRGFRRMRVARRATFACITLYAIVLAIIVAYNHTAGWFLFGVHVGILFIVAIRFFFGWSLLLLGGYAGNFMPEPRTRVFRKLGRLIMFLTPAVLAIFIVFAFPMIFILSSPGIGISPTAGMVMVLMATIIYMVAGVWEIVLTFKVLNRLGKADDDPSGGLGRVERAMFNYVALFVSALIASIPLELVWHDAKWLHIIMLILVVRSIMIITRRTGKAFVAAVEHNRTVETDRATAQQVCPPRSARRCPASDSRN